MAHESKDERRRQMEIKKTYADWYAHNIQTWSSQNFPDYYRNWEIGKADQIRAGRAGL